VTEVLTHSRLRTYRECARLHDLKYRQMFRPVKEGDALRFGTLMHLGLAAWWRGEDVILKSDDEFELVKARELMLGYDHAYRIARERTYDVLSVEEKFDMPLINPETMLPSRTWRLGGKLDTMLRVKETGRVVVLEHKTTSDALDDVDYWSRLAMDMQISIYTLGAESLGYEVDDLLYDVIHKPGIRPLKRTENPKYKANGELYANQRAADETPEEYGERLRADIAENVGKYYKQLAIPRMNSQIEDAMFDMWQSGQEIRAGALAHRAPRNPEACLRYSRCPFWDVCTSGLKPEEHPELFRVAETMHEELV
jgi:hypothetical protein